MKSIYFLLFNLLIFNSTCAQKWEYLFDGHSLDGWSVLDKPADIKIRDSSMVLHMTPYTSRHSFIQTNKAFKNFIFEVDFKRDLTIDSGILFRSVDAPDTSFSALYGYMVKIDPSLTRKWTGGVFLDFGNSLQWLHSLEGNEAGKQAEKPEREWNKIRIEAIGESLKVWVNGVSTVNLIDDKYRKGYLAFKIHYLMAEKEKANLEIAYRNPRILTKNIKKYTWVNNLPPKDTRGALNLTYFR